MVISCNILLEGCIYVSGKVFNDFLVKWFVGKFFIGYVCSKNGIKLMWNILDGFGSLFDSM